MIILETRNENGIFLFMRREDVINAVTRNDYGRSRIWDVREGMSDPEVVFVERSQVGRLPKVKEELVAKVQRMTWINHQTGLGRVAQIVIETLDFPCISRQTIA
jgi:hypothetical protein